MKSDLFYWQNHAAEGHVNSIHPVRRCSEKNYTKRDDGLDAQSANNYLEGTTERQYKNKILKNKSCNMTVAMGGDKRYADERTSAAS